MYEDIIKRESEIFGMKINKCTIECRTQEEFFKANPGVEKLIPTATVLIEQIDHRASELWYPLSDQLKARYKNRGRVFLFMLSKESDKEFVNRLEQTVWLWKHMEYPHIKQMVEDERDLLEYNRLEAKLLREVNLGPKERERFWALLDRSEELEARVAEGRSYLRKLYPGVLLGVEDYFSV